MNKITIVEDITRSVKVSNNEQDERRYDIEGVAQMEHGEVKRIESVKVKLGERTIAEVIVGNVTKGNFIIDPMAKASDDVESPYEMTGSFRGDTENTNSIIIEEIEKFVDDVKELLNVGKED